MVAKDIANFIGYQGACDKLDRDGPVAEAARFRGHQRVPFLLSAPE
jgi:hypothetical protein